MNVLLETRRKSHERLERFIGKKQADRMEASGLTDEQLLLMSLKSELCFTQEKLKKCVKSLDALIYRDREFDAEMCRYSNLLSRLEELHDACNDIRSILVL